MLHLPDATLPSYGYLSTLSIVTSEYVGTVVADWKQDPPDEDFTNILDCDLETFTDNVGVINYGDLPQTHSQTDATDLGLPEFYFSTKSQRYHYRDSGAFVSQAAIDNLTSKAIAQKRREIRDLGEKLIGNLVTLEDWERQTAGHLKQLHTWTYLLGKGGQRNLNQSDYGRLGLRLSYEYGYLRGFAETIRDEGMSEAQFLARLELYINKTRGTRQQAIRYGHKESGSKWERRRLSAVDNCNSCKRYAAIGWQNIGVLPAPTEQCECQANCKCYFEFSDSLSRPQDILVRKLGWL